MLFLFNSGSRPLYTINVLNTLSLPRESVNEYRYKYSDRIQYLSTDLVSSLDSLAKTKAETVIVFIDRFGDTGYRYHPLRLGKFIEWKKEADQIFLRVSLLDYVFSIDPDQVTRQFVQALKDKRLPVLTNGDPMEPHDGHYAIENPNFLQNLLEVGDASWGKTVDAISSAHAFAGDKDQAPLFTRLRLEASFSKRQVEPSIRGGVSTYNLKEATEYRAVITYRFPRQISDNRSHGEVQVLTAENLAPSATTIGIDSHANTIEISLQSVPKSEEAAGSIRIEPSVTQGQPAVIVSSAALNYRLVKGSKFWIKLALVAFVYALAAALQGVDLSRILSLSHSQLAWTIVPKFALGVFQIGAIYSAIKLVGTKIM